MASCSVDVKIGHVMGKPRVLGHLAMDSEYGYHIYFAYFIGFLSNVPLQPAEQK